MEHTARKLIIIGGGPTAWAAAIYTARADLHPLVLAGETPGGQLMSTTVIENYPGFSEGIEGPLLMGEMRKQAERFGTEVVEERVVSVSQRHSVAALFTVKTENGEYEAEAVLVATGAESVWLGVPGEQSYIGRGVSTCAVCDAAFFRGKRTVVVGGGDSAMEDALALTKFAESVTIVHRRDSFRASKVMVERVLSNPKVTVLWNQGVKEIVGDTKVTGITLVDLETEKTNTVSTDGVFVAIGHKPTTAFVNDIVAVDQRGYIKTSFGLSAEYPTMTSVTGIFSAGDCVDFKYRQAATASAFGVMAALDIERWLDEKTFIK